MVIQSTLSGCIRRLLHHTTLPRHREQYHSFLKHANPPVYEKYRTFYPAHVEKMFLLCVVLCLSSALGQATHYPTVRILFPVPKLEVPTPRACSAQCAADETIQLIVMFVLW